MVCRALQKREATPRQGRKTKTLPQPKYRTDTSHPLRMAKVESRLVCQTELSRRMKARSQLEYRTELTPHL